MLLNVKKLTENLCNAAEDEPSDNKTDFKRLLRVASGNKIALQQVSLDEIVEMIENLDDILEKEFSPNYPVIDLSKIERSRLILRRAI